MTGFGVNLAVAILFGWAGFAMAALVLPVWAALLLGAVGGAASATLLRKTIVIGGFVALLAPFGVMLPALAVRNVATTLGVPIPGFSAPEILVFLILYTAYLAAAFGKLPVDLYRLGYAPRPVALMVLTLCAYSFLTGNWFLALVAVAGQAFWTLGWGSSNWFDHVLHVLLWPLAVVVLFAQIF